MIGYFEPSANCPISSMSEYSNIHLSIAETFDNGFFQFETLWRIENLFSARKQTTLQLSLCFWIHGAFNISWKHLM